ncbi:MAG: sulfotransferase [Thermoanaerobaculia bacterium]
MAADRLKVLYVTGFGRSGTTILDNILGQLDGVFAAGELHYIWDRSLEQNRLCACGEAFSNCPVWQRIMAALGTDYEPDTARLVQLRESLNPRRSIWARLRGSSHTASPEVAEYAAAMERLYRAVADATDSRVVVDSSKSPALGHLLDVMPGIDPYVVHLVRDPRAVAFSWLKKKVYDPGGDEPMYMSQHPPARSAKLWLVWNLTAEMIWARRSGRYLRLRYEDFTDRPRETLEKVVRLILDEVPPLPFVSDFEVDLTRSHSMAGNPSRFETGTVTIRRDDTWRQELPKSVQRLVTLLTWPLARRYGY